MTKRFYSMYKNEEKQSADIYIYGDITSWAWFDGDVSSYTLSKELDELKDVDNINVYINSYGGEVGEGAAIYNALKRHPAQITTYSDGFACSIASVIFSAGDKRIMSNTSLLMIHNALVNGVKGNAEQLRKRAEDLDTINEIAINAYKNIVNIDEAKIKELMNEETWINSTDALEMGFATEVIEAKEDESVTQSVRNSIVEMITEEPEKVAVANVNFDEDKLKEIVQKGIQELEAKLLKQDNPEQIEDKPKNELSETLLGFFNAQNKGEK